MLEDPLQQGNQGDPQGNHTEIASKFPSGVSHPDELP